MGSLEKSAKTHQNILQRISPQEKWNEVLRLREAAWQLKVAFVKSQHPNWKQERVHAEVKKIFLYATT